MTLVIAGPVFVLCVCVLTVFFYLWHKKHSPKQGYHPEQANPLIDKFHNFDSGISTDPSGRVHEIIGEMTGSGSGGGMLSKSLYCVSFCFEIYF